MAKEKEKPKVKDPKTIKPAGGKQGELSVKDLNRVSGGECTDKGHHR